MPKVPPLPDLVRLIGLALPPVLGWIDETVAAHADAAVPVLDVPGAGAAARARFPDDLLAAARVVPVDRVPLPPLSRLGFPPGLPHLDAFEGMAADGVTYGDTFFVRRARADDPALFIHELVHVVQWRTLGREGFLVAYALGLLEHGYRASPLEAMAFEIGERLARGELQGDVAGEVAGRCRAALGRGDPAAFGGA